MAYMAKTNTEKRRRVAKTRKVIRRTRPDFYSEATLEAVRRRLTDPDVAASAAVFVRRVVQVLPESLEQLRRGSEAASKAFAAKREIAEQEMRRGAEAIGPDGKRPSGRLLPRR